MEPLPDDVVFNIESSQMAISKNEIQEGIARMKMGEKEMYNNLILNAATSGANMVMEGAVTAAAGSLVNNMSSKVLRNRVQAASSSMISGVFGGAIGAFTAIAIPMQKINTELSGNEIFDSFKSMLLWDIHSLIEGREREKFDEQIGALEASMSSIESLIDASSGNEMLSEIFEEAIDSMAEMMTGLGIKTADAIAVSELDLLGKIYPKLLQREFSIMTDYYTFLRTNKDDRAEEMVMRFNRRKKEVLMNPFIYAESLLELWPEDVNNSIQIKATSQQQTGELEESGNYVDDAYVVDMEHPSRANERKISFQCGVRPDYIAFGALEDFKTSAFNVFTSDKVIPEGAIKEDGQKICYEDVCAMTKCGRDIARMKASFLSDTIRDYEEIFELTAAFVEVLKDWEIDAGVQVDEKMMQSSLEELLTQVPPDQIFFASVCERLVMPENQPEFMHHKFPVCLMDQSSVTSKGYNNLCPLNQEFVYALPDIYSDQDCLSSKTIFHGTTGDETTAMEHLKGKSGVCHPFTNPFEKLNKTG